MILKKILRLLFDNRCILCGSRKISEKIDMICNDCLKAFDKKKLIFCRLCGHPLDDFNQCPSCGKLGKINFDSYVFVQYYTDFIKRIIYMLKKDGNFVINKLFFRLLLYKNIIKKDGIITTVPDNFFRKFKKGRSGLSFLLKMFRRNGFKVNEKIIHKKLRFFASQKSKTARKRIEEIKESYFLSDENSNKFKGKVYLIDDVYTTGSTLNYCSELLKKAGFRNVTAVSFVRAVINSK